MAIWASFAAWRLLGDETAEKAVLSATLLYLTFSPALSSLSSTVGRNLDNSALDLDIFSQGEIPGDSL